MTKELVIQTSAKGADIALLEDRRLMELHHDDVAEDFLVGDIYLGRVRKLLPNLNAAFIDIGHDKDAFLHYLDLGPNIKSLNRYIELVKKGKLRDTKLSQFRFEPEIVKTGKIDEVFVPNQLVAVQIVKEPISTKGPRLSSQISLSGRYIILIPFNESVSLSKKIKGKPERERLRKILSGLKEKNFGIIIRTNAEDASVADLEQDLKKLMADWEKLVQALVENKIKLYSELDRTASLLRDIVNSSFSRITVDNPVLYKQVRGYLQAVAPGTEDIVKLHKSDKTLFEQFDVEKQIKSLFNKIVNLSGGAYLIIEHTEAMHVIDVNSGSKRGKDDNQEENALRTNTEAAEEIVRQLRLRDMGGIVVIDFIDMRSIGNRKKLFDNMKELMKTDRAKHTILPVSKFGLMQITRQRVRQEIVHDTSEPCPVCNGTGEISKGVLITEDIRRKIETALHAPGKKTITLKVHPFVHAYFTQGFISERMRWFLKFGKWVNLHAVENYVLNQYEIE
ncbi:MAG: Rne/Rng family ribonuclease [Bacteroidia bacterium]